MFLSCLPQLDNIMNIVPRVAGSRVAGKNHADQTFFHRDRITDFELRFVPAARDRSMWCWLHLSNFDAPVLSRPGEYVHPRKRP
jgi:hypothetical protein